jgi:hypothetical protein
LRQQLIHLSAKQYGYSFLTAYSPKRENLKKEECVRKKLGLILVAAFLLFGASPAFSTDRVTVAPAEFHSVNGAADQLQGQYGWAGYVYRTPTSTTEQFMAQVDLPHGVIIKYVRMHYLDNDASNDIAVALVRTNKYTGGENALYVIWSSGASAAIQYSDDFSVSPSPSYALTNTDACTYTIYLDIRGTDSSTMRFYGVTIVYE